MLSFKLAFSNLHRSFKSFAPFLLASLTLFVILFTMANLALSPSITKATVTGKNAIPLLMELGFFILSIFTVILMIYSYRFLSLLRSREFGLYHILGLEQWRVVSVALFELFFLYLLTVLIGLVIGTVFAKLMFLIFVHLIGGTYYNLIIAPMAVLLVMLLFALIFLLLAFLGGILIARKSGLSLFSESAKGEREPKANIIFAFLGFIFLAIGYYMALSVQNPLKALTTFAFAVLAVILGTYFFYISSTVWYLKWKKKRPSYYKPQNFITTSSMLYRMKQNAAGLANITILLSMTIVTITLTAGVYTGVGKTVAQLYPQNTQVVSSQNLSREKLASLVKTAAAETGPSASHLAVTSASPELFVSQKLDSNNILSLNNPSSNLQSQLIVTFITRADMEALGNQLPALTADQVLLYDFTGSTQGVRAIDWLGERLSVNQHLTHIKNFPTFSQPINSSLIIVADDTAMTRLMKTYSRSDNSGAIYINPVTAQFDLPESKQAAFRKTLNKLTQTKEASQGIMTSFRSEQMKSAQNSIGILLFIGLILGVSFILGAALIIYYKQISEGTQDKHSYRILQEVGLSKIEVAKTIKSQVRMIFFLPLVVAVIHFAFAYLMLSKIINVFGIYDPTLVLTVALSTIIGVAVVYWLIYKGTSRAYYRIVERR